MIVYAVYQLEVGKYRYKYRRQFRHLKSACEYCDSLQDGNVSGVYLLIRAFDLEKGPIRNYIYHAGLLDPLYHDKYIFLNNEDAYLALADFSEALEDELL